MGTNARLHDWARKWGMGGIALDELCEIFANPLGAAIPTMGIPLSEAGVMARVRLEASRKGLRLWRNNVGAATMIEGGFVRYGLANESSRMNAVIKSSDLIGIRPVIITPSHVGRTLGQFVSREIKREDWVYSGNEREESQLAWLKLVTALGGDACFAAGEGTL